MVAAQFPMSHNGVVWKDLLHGVRALRRSPVFTTAAVLSLALGIGANTAIFSLLDQVVLRSLPIADPETAGCRAWQLFRARRELVELVDELRVRFPVPVLPRPARSRSGVCRPSGLCHCAGADRAGAPARRRLRPNSSPAITSPRWESRAALGRVIAPDDDGAPGASPVAVLSHAFWSSHLGANPAIVNQTVAINGQPFVVIGVAGADFNGLVQGDSPDLFVPIAMQRAIAPAMTVDRRSHL